jgi:hypothetical protein
MHPNLERKTKPQAFEGDFVNQIFRLHEFAVATGGFRDIWHCDYHRAGSGKVQVHTCAPLSLAFDLFGL